MCIYYTQYIAGNPMLTQEFIPAHRFFVSGFPALGDTVDIVHFRRAVQAQSDGKAF